MMLKPPSVCSANSLRRKEPSTVRLEACGTPCLVGMHNIMFVFFSMEQSVWEAYLSELTLLISPAFIIPIAGTSSFHSEAVSDPPHLAFTGRIISICPAAGHSSCVFRKGFLAKKQNY